MCTSAFGGRYVIEVEHPLDVEGDVLVTFDEGETPSDIHFPGEIDANAVLDLHLLEFH